MRPLLGIPLPELGYDLTIINIIGFYCHNTTIKHRTITEHFALGTYQELNLSRKSASTVQ